MLEYTWFLAKREAKLSGINKHHRADIFKKYFKGYKKYKTYYLIK